MREALMHHLTLTGIEQAVSRLTSHLKASAPKLKHGAMAVRHWMILQSRLGRLATAIGSGPMLAGVRQRSATFTPQKLPKAPQMNKAPELDD
jgi:hypothetical protein